MRCTVRRFSRLHKWLIVVKDDGFYVALAELWASRSTCVRAAVGCVITDANGFVLSSGYNGAPSGVQHCTDVGCLLDPDGHCVRSVHAEMNAIITAAKTGVPLAGGTIYTTTRPCVRCTVALIQAGIKTIVWKKHYKSESEVLAETLLADTDVEIRGIIYE